MAKFRCKALNDISNNIKGIKDKPYWMIVDEIYAELERWLSEDRQNSWRNECRNVQQDHQQEASQERHRKDRQEDLFKVFCHFCSIIEVDLFKKFIETGMKFDERICKKSPNALKNFAGIVYMYIMCGIIDQVPVHMVVLEVMLVVVTWPRGSELKVMLQFLEESGWILNTFIRDKIFYLGANSYSYNVYYDYAIRNKFEVNGAVLCKIGNVYALKHFHTIGYKVVTENNYEYNIRENNIASTSFLKPLIEEVRAKKALNKMKKSIAEVKKELCMQVGRDQLAKEHLQSLRVIKYERDLKLREKKQKKALRAKSNTFAAFNK